MAVRYFLGIDGGGTGSRSLLTNAAGDELARAKGGHSQVATDMSEACANLSDLTRRTFEAAGLGEAEMGQTYAVLGLAGSNVVPDLTPVEEVIPSPHVYVTNDPEVVLAGALGDADGALAAPGTGSFFVCRKAGIVKGLGGWGFVLGDEASGAGLGRRLLQITIHAHDGVEAHSDLTRAILAEFQGEPSRMVQFANKASPGEFGKYARHVVQAGSSGDAIAARLMQEGADWIVRAFDALGYEPGMRICLWGGLGAEYKAYLPADMAALVTPPEGDAAMGAAQIARRRGAEL